MMFAVKCSRHFPGYEVSHASDIGQLKKQFESWRTCDPDASSILELPDGEVVEDITKKLDSWKEEFEKKH